MDSRQQTGSKSGRVTAEFIKGAVVYENKYSFNSTELTSLLQKVYEFSIPESVVRTTLNNKLKDSVEKKDGYYHFDKKIKDEFTAINSDFETINSTQTKINESLVTYVETKDKKSLSEAERNELFSNFTHFLLDNGFSDRYSNHISAFVISNQNTPEFTNSLNAIREGLILYQGIKYTADINELGKWNNDLTVYLNTEHLFSALGYNGILFQEIFNDFFNLVNEINISSKSTNRRRVELQYFEETKLEVDNYFLTAESIKKGYKPLDPSRSAMKTILEKSKTSSEIKALRVKFDIDLKKMGIVLKEFNHDISSIARYNVEDEGILQQLKKESEKAKKSFDDQACRQFFRIFTKVNYFRKGDSRKAFEKIGHIFITENRFAKYLAHKSIVKFEEYDTPFAKDIDYIITRFWFKLKKGFSDKQSLPKSFDVVTKAKIILSSHIATSVSQGYHKLLEETKSGILTKEEAIERSYEFRERPNKPEEINAENLESTLAFLNTETFFEDFYREKERKETLYTETEARNLELTKELDRIKQLEKEKEKALELDKFNNLKNAYANSSLSNEKKKKWIDLFRLILIFLLNLFLATFATIAGFTVQLKNWFSEFGAFQIMIITTYILILTVEVFARSYIFNKESIKSGWIWLTCLTNRAQYRHFVQEQLEIYNKEFEKKHY